MFEDLLRLCVLPLIGGRVQARTGHFRRIRLPGLSVATKAPPFDETAKQLQAHLAYMAFKKSSKKRYERKATAAVEQPVVLSATERSAEYERMSDEVLDAKQRDQAERMRAARERR